jgi:hypothetical protein
MKEKIFLFFLLFSIAACNKSEDNDDGNSGGNDNCQWEKSSNKLELVSVSAGTECGNDSTSLAVTFKMCRMQK